MFRKTFRSETGFMSLRKGTKTSTVRTCRPAHPLALPIERGHSTPTPHTHHTNGQRSFVQCPFLEIEIKANRKGVEARCNKAIKIFIVGKLLGPKFGIVANGLDSGAGGGN